MNKFDKIKKRLGYRLTALEIANFRLAKHEAACRAFTKMVKITNIDSQDLFNHIYVCFEENGRSRPYHDWYHTCCVVEGTVQGLCYHLQANLDNLFETQQKEVNSTILAAAFHDIGHSGVKLPDIVNISRSINIAHHFLTSTDTYIKAIYSGTLDLSFVLETLQSTQYPFRREPLNEYQAILRDADLLQILEPTWFDDIYYNMYQEFLEGNPTLDFVDFCEGEVRFMRDIKFYSIWFREQMHNAFSEIALLRVKQAILATRECLF